MFDSEDPLCGVVLTAETERYVRRVYRSYFVAGMIGGGLLVGIVAFMLALYG